MEAHSIANINNLSGPQKREIYLRLFPSQVFDQFDLSQPTISSHIKVLESAGIVSRTREAQTRPCQLVAERLEEINEWLGQVQDVWEGNYKRLDALLLELKQARKKGKK